MTFSSDTAFENNWDYLEILDANDNRVGLYTGTQLAGQTVNVPGDTVKFRVTTDGSVSSSGYTVTKIVSGNTEITTNLPSQRNLGNNLNTTTAYAAPGSGLYYCQTRYYDPVVGRFINADGLASNGAGILGNNMYAYCVNNPVLLCDPSGTTPQDAQRWANTSQARQLAMVANFAPRMSDRQSAQVAYMVAYAYYYNLPYPDWVYKASAQIKAQADAAAAEAEKKKKVAPVAGKKTKGTTYPGHMNSRDIAAPAGTPIYAAMGGEITLVVNHFPNSYNGNNLGYGNHVKIVVWDGATMIYGHMLQGSPAVEGPVKAGDLIGYVGNTGNSQGNHLHIEVKNGGSVFDYFLY